MKEQKNKLKIVIIVLAVLLALSVAGLAVILLYDHFAPNEPAFVELPGNIITPDAEGDPTVEPTLPVSGTQGSGADRETALGTEPGTDGTRPNGAAVSGTNANSLVLYNKRPGDNIIFRVAEMYPGDVQVEHYRIKVAYKGNIVVRYHADIREGSEKLAEVLQLRIYLPDTDELLYDGPIKDMPRSVDDPLFTRARTQSELYYEITAYLDTSVGNEYMDKALIADFRWWVEETNNLDSPVTGDTSNVRLWIYLAAGSLFLLLILLAVRRREADDEVE